MRQLVLAVSLLSDERSVNSWSAAATDAADAVVSAILLLLLGVAEIHCTEARLLRTNADLHLLLKMLN